ncbi:MAG: condensation domain-containing protein [Methylococcaceae bacterium]
MAQDNSSYRLPAIQFGVIFDFYFSQLKNAYTQQHIWTLNETLEIEAFQRAWNQLIERHEALRTSFDLIKKLGIIHNDTSITIHHYDWTEIHSRDVDGRFQRFLKEDRAQKLDLSIAPPFRVSLIKLAVDQYRLVWTYHHGSFDGRARFLLVKELFMLYQAAVQEAPLGLQKPTSYRQYCDWVTSLDMSESIKYWKRVLKEFTPAPQINRLLRSSTPETYMNSDQKSIQLSENVHQTIKDFAKSQDVTVSTLIQAAWILVLSKTAELDDVAIGVIRTCRSSAFPELKSIVGLLINVVPIRMEISKNHTLNEWLKTLREQWINMRDHIHVPLTDITKAIELPPGNKLFQTTIMFDTQDETEELQSLGNEWLNRSFRKIENNTVDLELNITAYKTMNIMLEYSSERFDIATIDLLLEEFAATLVKMTLGGQQSISSLVGR